jgi:acyl-CoA thioesterase-2
MTLTTLTQPDPAAGNPFDGSAQGPADDPTQALRGLVDLLTLEQFEHNLFRGQNRDFGSPAVFGGQVLGQALMAAARTVADSQSVNSLHGYFLRAGDKSVPIVYEVDRIRDGASFATRRVVAIQHGQAIFHMSASFHKSEGGPAHQGTMPDAPPPEQLEDEHLRQRAIADQLPQRMRAFLQQPQPVDLRAVDPMDLLAPEVRPAYALHWLRAAAALPDDPLLHQALLAYASDWSLMRVAMLPHQLNFTKPAVQGVSLDHAMWFHRDFRFDEWLLYQSDSPSLAGARGFCRGSLWSRDGRLVASVAQEGLIRVR